MSNGRRLGPGSKALMDIEDITVLDQQETPIETFTKADIDATLKVLLKRTKQRKTQNSTSARNSANSTPSARSVPLPAPTRDGTGTTHTRRPATPTTHPPADSGTLPPRSTTPPTLANTPLSPSHVKSPFSRNVPVIQPKAPTDEQIRRVEELSTAQRYMSIPKAVTGRSPTKSRRFGSQGETVVPIDNDDVIKVPGRSRHLIHFDDDEDNESDDSNDSVEFLGREVISLSDGSSDKDEEMYPTRRRATRTKSSKHSDDKSFSMDDSSPVLNDSESERYRYVKENDDEFVIEDDDVIVSDTDAAYSALNKALSPGSQAKQTQERSKAKTTRTKASDKQTSDMIRNRIASEKYQRRMEIEMKRKQMKQGEANSNVSVNTPKWQPRTTNQVHHRPEGGSTLGPPLTLPESSQEDTPLLQKKRSKKRVIESENEDETGTHSAGESLQHISPSKLGTQRKITGDPSNHGERSRSGISHLTKSGLRKHTNNLTSPAANSSTSHYIPPSFLPVAKISHKKSVKHAPRKPTMNNVSSVGAVPVVREMKKAGYGHHIHAASELTQNALVHDGNDDIDYSKSTSEHEKPEKSMNKGAPVSINTPRLQRKESMSSLDKPKVGRPSASSLQAHRDKWHGTPAIRRSFSSSSTTSDPSQPKLTDDVPIVKVTPHNTNPTMVTSMDNATCSPRKVAASHNKKRPELAIFLESTNKKKRKANNDNERTLQSKAKDQTKELVEKDEDIDLDSLFEDSQSQAKSTDDPIEEEEEEAMHQKVASSQSPADSLDYLFDQSLPTRTADSVSGENEALEIIPATVFPNKTLVSPPSANSPDILLASRVQASQKRALDGSAVSLPKKTKNSKEKLSTSRKQTNGDSDGLPKNHLPVSSKKRTTLAKGPIVSSSQPNLRNHSTQSVFTHAVPVEVLGRIKTQPPPPHKFKNSRTSQLPTDFSHQLSPNPLLHKVNVSNQVRAESKTPQSLFALNLDHEDDDGPLVNTQDLDGIMKQLKSRGPDQELNSKNSSLSHSDLSQMTPVSNGVSPFNSPESLSLGSILNANQKTSGATRSDVDLTYSSTDHSSDKSGLLEPRTTKGDGPPQITGPLPLKPNPPVSVEPIVPRWTSSSFSNRSQSQRRKESESEDSDTEVIGSPVKLRTRSPVPRSKSGLFVPADSDDESQAVIVGRDEQQLQSLSDFDDSDDSDVEMMTEAEYLRATQRTWVLI